MRSVPGGIGEDELTAYVDGRLPADRAAVVEQYLAAHPEQQDRLRHYIEQQQELRSAVTAQPVPPIPARLRVARLVEGRRRRSYHQWFLAAAGVVLLVAGGVGGWFTHGSMLMGLPSARTAAAATTARDITADAIAAHRVYSVEVRHPVEVAATQEGHLVQWLSKRLGRPLVVPDLTAAGYQLMGGRLLPSEAGPAAQFMYQNGSTRLTLYERADTTGETKFLYSEENGIGAFYWSDQDFGYALAAKVSRPQLLQLAEIVYHQLSDAGAKTKPPGAKTKPPPSLPGKPS